MYKGECIVHASSEDLAREYASRKFWIAAAKGPDGVLPINPWNQPDRVNCQEIADRGPAPHVDGLVEIPT